MFPRIYLAIDNCFASKRWTRPTEWMSLIAGAGLAYVETSADTECDPLYHGHEYLARWTDDVKDAASNHRCHIANIYSGHGTYATLGLAHTDTGVRDRFLRRWLMPMVDVAEELECGLGFFAHAFPQSVINDANRFGDAIDDLYDRLAELASYAAGKPRVGPIGVEQMYSPHQVPWTIAQGEELLSEVFRRKSAPFYLTLDVGHAGGQRRHLKPTCETVADAMRACISGEACAPPWIGSERANALFDAAVQNLSTDEDPRVVEREISAIVDDFDRNPHLFGEVRDGDPYEWLRRLAGWSPIVHLQQTDGASSPHWAFTEESNSGGAIDPLAVLRAIHDHYVGVDAGEASDMPPRVEEIYLTLEVFSATAEHPRAIVKKIEESAAYWRQYIPTDGATVDQIVQ